MTETKDPRAEKELQPWETPGLRNIDLTDEEVAALRASDDPMALLFEMKPELAGGNRAGK
jgi:hypothetical protein